MMPRLTIRARLTILYAGLVLLAGLLLLGITYVLMSQNLPTNLGLAREYSAQLPQPEPGVSAVDNFRVLVRQVEEDTRRAAMVSLLTQGSLALAVVVAIAVALAWLITARALQPINQITATARRIGGAPGTGRGLHERIALNGPRDEVRELADTFDLMLERLDRSFDGQRRFVANASHELRTPLALNRSLVELAITHPDAGDDVKRLGEALLTVNERHERLIDGLLTLADSENEAPERTPVDVADIAAYVVDQAAKEDISVETMLVTAPVAGDPILLERLTQNLVENAIRHNLPSGGRLSVRTDVIPGWSRLIVSNTGPLVPPYEIEALFQPFRRLRHERTARGRGFGLGLSIVRAVARAHGGEATAVPNVGGGLTVTVVLPLLRQL